MRTWIRALSRFCEDLLPDYQLLCRGQELAPSQHQRQGYTRLFTWHFSVLDAAI